MRRPYQILVFPYFKKNGDYYYAIFKRKDLKVWQGIAGGGEEGENPPETAQREAFEEAGISMDSHYLRLSAISTIPADKISGLKWDKQVVMIPEFAFGVEVFSQDLKIEQEHTQLSWCKEENALKKLEWDSNKSALWELNYRLKNNDFEGIKINTDAINKFL